MVKSFRIVTVAVALLIGAACSDSSSPPQNTITILDGDDQTGTVASLVATDPSVTVHDPAGAPLSGATVTFSITLGGGATRDTTVTTNSAGIATTEWYLGPAQGAENRLSASLGNASVEFSAVSEAAAVGTSLFGTSSFIEYIPGDLPIIVSAPHGGALEPASIPDRTAGTLATDLNTVDLARKISDRIFARTQHHPHIIICHLRRTKLDANRTIPEAAQGNRSAQRAWYEYHSYLDAARSAVTAQSQRGLYLDVHGHGHAIQRLELGYLLSGAELEFTDATLESSVFATSSSIRALWQSTGTSFPVLLRGPFSLGTMLTQAGYPSVPSTIQPNPAGAEYFSGGYSTERHGSLVAGSISAVQIEANFNGVRDSDNNRQLFATALAAVLEEYLNRHFGIDITP